MYGKSIEVPSATTLVSFCSQIVVRIILRSPIATFEIVYSFLCCYALVLLKYYTGKIFKALCKYQNQSICANVEWNPKKKTKKVNRSKSTVSMWKTFTVPYKEKFIDRCPQTGLERIGLKRENLLTFFKAFVCWKTLKKKLQVNGYSVGNNGMISR